MRNKVIIGSRFQLFTVFLLSAAALATLFPSFLPSAAHILRLQTGYNRIYTMIILIKIEGWLSFVRIRRKIIIGYGPCRFVNQTLSDAVSVISSRALIWCLERRQGNPVTVTRPSLFWVVKLWLLWLRSFSEEHDRYPNSNVSFC